MNISTSAWHYKLVRMFSNMKDDVPRSLCPYMLRLVWALFVVGIIVPLAIYGVGLVLTLWLSDTYTLSSYSKWLIAIFGEKGFVAWMSGFILLAAAGLLGIVALFCAAALTACGIIATLYYAYQEYLKPHDPEIKSELLSAWWDGIKNRYCPTITFVDKKD